MSWFHHLGLGAPFSPLHAALPGPVSHLSSKSYGWILRETGLGCEMQNEGLVKSTENALKGLFLSIQTLNEHLPHARLFSKLLKIFIHSILFTTL